MQSPGIQILNLPERVTEFLVQPIPNLEKGLKSGLEGRAQARTQRQRLLIPAQVLPAP